MARYWADVKQPASGILGSASVCGPGEVDESSERHVFKTFVEARGEDHNLDPTAAMRRALADAQELAAQMNVAFCRGLNGEGEPEELPLFEQNAFQDGKLAREQGVMNRAQTN